MKSAYDIIVVGAGPAGSAAAIRAAQAGLDVLLIEKRQEIGVPVRCGEATDIETTERFVDLDPRWINNHVETYAICSASGDVVSVPPSGDTIIVDRKVFDEALAAQAVREGAEVRVNTAAVDLIWNGDTVAGVRLQSFGKSHNVRARLVVAADGVESLVARWAGLKTVPAMNDFFVGAQYTLAGLRGRLDPSRCEYHVGQETIAPGGYVWVFPKSDEKANVGVVIPGGRNRETSATEWLDRFVTRHFEGASVLSVVSGGIPVTGAIKQMVVNGLVVVGDAAHQADPLTAGGISLGMMGAELAMETAIPALARGDVSTRALHPYEEAWRARFGQMHTALLAIRKIITRMSQRDFDALVRTAAGLPLATMSLGEILLAVLSRHPALLLEARTLITTGLVLK
ncbi:MAG: NAD(P)/FAD-dependent oxidoreductase [Anaerolineae bacterium]|nr:NAD(P)/FAD-dependent oxidoreductase [Anaerolineae bacterium]